MRWGVGLIVLGALAVYAWQGVFSVDPDEQAVVLRLGQYHRTVDPGRYLFHFPWLERHEKRPVTQLIDVEFGFRTQSSEDGTEYVDQPDEKRMITTDENLLDVEFVVRYKIANLRNYLFEMADPTRMIRDAAAATARSVVARYAVDTVLKGGRERIESETLVALRATLDAYEAGVQILSVQLQDVEPPNPVIDAFAEVTSAEQEGERLVSKLAPTRKRSSPKRAAKPRSWSTEPARTGRRGSCAPRARASAFGRS